MSFNSGGYMTAEYRKAKSHTYCKFCKAEGIKCVATVMTRFAPRMGMRDHAKHYSCLDHAVLLEDTDPNRTRSEELLKLKKVKAAPDTGEYSEADYQTWLRL